MDAGWAAHPRMNAIEINNTAIVATVTMTEPRDVVVPDFILSFWFELVKTLTMTSHEPRCHSVTSNADDPTWSSFESSVFGSSFCAWSQPCRS